MDGMGTIIWGLWISRSFWIEKVTYINPAVSDFVLWRETLTLAGQTKSIQMQHISYMHMIKKENSNHNLSHFIFIFIQNDDLSLFPSKGPHKTARGYFKWSL